MNYKAADIAKFFNKYHKHATHVVVAHTKIHTFGMKEMAIKRSAEQAKKDLRYALKDGLNNSPPVRVSGR
jgi:hypothetical protein